MLSINIIKNLFNDQSSGGQVTRVTTNEPIRVRGFDPYAGEMGGWIEGDAVMWRDWPYVDQFSGYRGIYIVMDQGTAYVPDLPGWIEEL